MKNENNTLLESLFNELNETSIKEILKKASRIRKEFEKNGHTWKKIDETKRKRFFDIIKNEKAYEDLFLYWYNKSKYAFLNDYFESSEYKKLNIKSGYVINNDDFWNRMKNSLSAESIHIDYFTNFSTIKFTDKQKKELEELRIAAVKKKSELEKNRITELEKENKSLKSISVTNAKLLEKLNDDIEVLKAKVTLKDTEISKLKSEKEICQKNFEEIELLNKKCETEYQNYTKQYEIGKALAFKNYLDEEKKKHDQDLQNFQKGCVEKRLKVEADEENKHKAFKNEKLHEQEKLNKEVTELTNSINDLKIKESKLQIDIELLEELKNTAIKEYSEYVKNGQQWYNLINGSKPSEVIELPQPAEITSADISSIGKYKSYFKNIKMNSDIDDIQDQISSFKKDRLKNVKKLFLPDTNFILCADSSWLSFDLFMQNSYGCLETSELLETISLKEFLEIAGANQDLNFKIIILSANRSPVECYLNPIIKAVKNKISIVYEKELLKIPKNVYWFLQFDDDDYCAKTDKLDIGVFE